MNTTPSRTPRPPKEVRDEIRRSQIVEAARHCVIRRGFHAAPMAEIARQAHMSVGQIYRYFASKDAIIRAIVEDIIARRLQRMMDNPESPYTPERLAARSPELDEWHAQDATLMLEVTAEATRNPEIAAIVADADRRSQAQAVRKMQKQHPGISREAASARCEVLAVLIEGTIFRRMTELQADPEALLALYGDMLEVILRD